MEIINKKTKFLLALLLIAMLTVTSVTFAILNGTVAHAAMTPMDKYANAQIGDIVTFGNYYQDASGITKTPIEWIVVDKDEKSNQLTLLSKYVLAGGSFWGNYFYDASNVGGFHSPTVGRGPGGNGNRINNQEWADSTLRAWLNNLERTDVHGDLFTQSGIQLYADTVHPTKANEIYVGAGSVGMDYQHSDLKYSVGYSNKNICTYLTSQDGSDLPADSGLHKRRDNTEVYYKRPQNTERPAVNGFLDVAFSQREQERIVPKVIESQSIRQWPDNYHDHNTMVLSQTTVDKIWVPSAAELNVTEGEDWHISGTPNGNWSQSGDGSSSSAFAYFRQFTTMESHAAALRATTTAFGLDPKLSNYSIPLDVPQDNIGSNNVQPNYDAADYWGNTGTCGYWLRTASSHWGHSVAQVRTTGIISNYGTSYSHFGVRPAMIFTYRALQGDKAAWE